MMMPHGRGYAGQGLRLQALPGRHDEVNLLFSTGDAVLLCIDMA
jgi:hypothetical protein